MFAYEYVCVVCVHVYVFTSECAWARGLTQWLRVLDSHRGTSCFKFPPLSLPHYDELCLWTVRAKSTLSP